MQNQSAVANSIAAAGKRFESMSILVEMVAAQLDRQRQEFQQIKSAIAANGAQPQSSPVAQADSSLAMLEG
jgi:hypothetical protein